MTSITHSPAATASSASARVPVLLTLAFWPAAICFPFFSPTVLDDLIGVPAIFLVYVLMLVGYVQLVEAKDRRRHPSTQRAPGLWLGLSREHGRPSSV
jgi:hypothetical protein